MTRAAVLLLLLAGCATPKPSVGFTSPRNVVVFIADDLGAGDLGCYGHPVVRTPNIDRIAREGIRFDRAFLTTSSCSPSRASILTGRYPHNTGAQDLHMALPAGQKSVARYLRAAGWHTMAAGKWHLGAAEKSHWDRIEECGGKDTAGAATRLLSERPKDKRFFFWVASVDPHRPYGEDLPAPHDPSKVVLPPYLPDHPLIRKEMTQYYGEIERLDRHVGEILAELERQGELDRTFIVFLSDNGMPFPRAKTTLYDSGIRTPLLMRCPSLIERGTVSKELVSSVDLAPTILDLAGVVADSMQGKSIVDQLLEPEAAVREAVFAEANWHDFDQFTRAVRTPRFLLVRNYYWDKPLWNSVDSIHSETWKGMMELKQAGKLTPAQAFLFRETRPLEEFYDLREDPHSLRSVVDDPKYREPLASVRIMLDNWRVETEDAMPRERRLEGWTRDGTPLPHNQPWYDRFLKEGRGAFEKF